MDPDKISQETFSSLILNKMLGNWLLRYTRVKHKPAFEQLTPDPSTPYRSN